MKVIIPMAGMGKRMRPHTLTTPKPLLPVAGKSIVERLVKNITSLTGLKVEEICFVTGRFGEEAEKHLKDVAESFGAKGTICYQDEALGTAHAVYCAKDALVGNTIVAFADTLFEGNFSFDNTSDAVVWVKQIDNPEAFGVVKVNDNNEITGFFEKPKEFISDLAIIGIYYFKSGEKLRSEIEYLINNKITKSGEYQLTDVLENMRKKGDILKPGKVDQWLDFGNKDVFIESVGAVLKSNGEHLVSKGIHNSNIIQPCYLGKNVSINNSTIGPNVSIEDNTIIDDCVISNSVIMDSSKLYSSTLSKSMIGKFVYMKDNKSPKEVNIGDYNTVILTHE